MRVRDTKGRVIMTRRENWRFAAKRRTAGLKIHKNRKIGICQKIGNAENVKKNVIGNAENVGRNRTNRTACRYLVSTAGLGAAQCADDAAQHQRLHLARRLRALPAAAATGRRHRLRGLVGEDLEQDVERRRTDGPQRVLLTAQTEGGGINSQFTSCYSSIYSTAVIFQFTVVIIFQFTVLVKVVIIFQFTC